VDSPDNVVKVLKEGQRKDGGWGKDGLPSDLETTYRVVRALVMLKAQPQHPKACRTFIARCRNVDGGYGLQPGQAGAANATYFAGILLHWLDRRK
jgi:hypothetical protein